MINFYPGFEYIRAIFCLAVVSLYTGLVTKLELTHPTIFYFIRYHLEFMAVPMFLLLSLFLYIVKRQSISMTVEKIENRANTSSAENAKNKEFKNKSLSKFNDYFSFRFKSILRMYISWRAIHFVITQNFSDFKTSEHILRALLGESSPTYFLLELLILTLITEFVFCKKQTEIPTTKIILYSLFSVLCMLSGSAFFQLIGFTMGYINPMNYLPCIPFAILSVKYFKIGKVNFSYLIFLIVGTCVFAIAEMYLQTKLINCGSFPPRIYGYIVYFPYARISLIFQAMLILYCCIFIKRDSPNFIKYYSNLSLSIFLIHTVVIFYLTVFFEYFEITINSPVLFLLTLSISVFLSHVLKKSKSFFKKYKPLFFKQNINKLFLR